MYIRTFVVVIVFILIGAEPMPGQHHRENGTWRSIVPLVSTLNEVESLLGPPTKIDGSGRYYDTSERERVSVWYSGAIGTAAGRWNVPDGTVIRVLISPRERVLLSHSGLNLSQFKKQRPMDDSGWNYIYLKQPNSELVKKTISVEARRLEAA